MGSAFTSPRTKLFAWVIVVDLIVIMGVAFPVAPINTSEPMFTFREYPVETDKCVYRWFDLERGNRINVEFTCDNDVNAYVFTRDQFTSFSDGVDIGNVDSSLMTASGKLDKRVTWSGTYFFVIHNPNNSPTDIIYSHGTGTTTTRVTLFQILRAHWLSTREIDADPFYKTGKISPLSNS